MTTTTWKPAVCTALLAAVALSPAMSGVRQAVAEGDGAAAVVIPAAGVTVAAGVTAAAGALVLVPGVVLGACPGCAAAEQPAMAVASASAPRLPAIVRTRKVPPVDKSPALTSSDATPRSPRRGLRWDRTAPLRCHEPALTVEIRRIYPVE